MAVYLSVPLPGPFRYSHRMGSGLFPLFVLTIKLLLWSSAWLVLGLVWIILHLASFILKRVRRHKTYYR